MGTLFFGYLYLQDPTDTLFPQSEENQGSIKYNQLQQFQQETDIKMDIEKQKAQMNKKLGGPELDPDHQKNNKFHKTELRKEADPRIYDLQDSSSDKAMTLDQRMDEFLAKKQRYEEMEKNQKNLYVKQFIKEAYSMGFIVVVNDKMEIESVTKRSD
jgi:hypothetical protein